MNDELHTPASLLEAVRYFSDPDVCHAYMIRVRWADERPSCPKCGSEKIGEIKSRRMFQCKAAECRKQFSTKVGTIFEDSALGLDKWFVAVWCVANCKNGVSSCELARSLDVTQKTAWHMLHRIRLAMQTKSFRKIKGEVESDETFIGGKATNMHHGKRKAKGTGGAGKTIVQGLLERGGEVRCVVKPNQRRAAMQSTVRENVEPGTAVYTDGLQSYKGLDADYLHGVVDHAVGYVLGRVHTNGLENFWSLLKRTLGGTYVAVAPEHLTRYLDEQ
jgi:transposase-like protein